MAAKLTCLERMYAATAAAISAATAAALVWPGGAGAVVGGREAAIQSIPFQVAIYRPQIVLHPGESPNPARSQFCAGVIRDATHVITAGHCVMNQQPGGVAAPATLEVLAGTNDLDTHDSQPHDYVEDPVAVTSFDPAWEPEAQAHDIGVLTLKEPLWQGPAPQIDGESRIAPIPLAESVPPPGTALTVSGWGYTKEKAGGEPPSEEGVAILRSTQLPLVASEECVRKYQGTGETVSPGTVCAGSGGHDACYQDSGGPLFESPPSPPTPSSPPGSYVLLGTVDFGYGCALAPYPGVFQSMVDPTNRRFALSDPPQAPLEESAPAISGAAAPGRTLTCSAGAWSGDPSYTYAFYADESSSSDSDARRALTTLSAQNTYTVSAGDAGARIFCEARATGAGGYDFDRSADVTVPGVGVSPFSARQSTPTLTVVSKLCIHRRCIVDVRASAGAGSAVAGVQAKITFRRQSACRRHGRPSMCLRTIAVRSRSRVTAIPGNRFMILTPRLAVGDYTLALIAVNRAGVRQARATDVKLAIRHERGRR